MKLYLSIFFALVLALPLVAQKPKPQDDPNEKPPFVRAALVGGMNISQVDGDGIAGFRKVGANAGAAAYVNLTKGFNASFEILYSMRGAKSSASQANFGEKLIINLDYIEVPFMVHYNDRDKAIFGAGVSWNTLVRNDVKGLQPDQSIDAKRSSLDFVGGVTFLIKKKFGINFRYSYSLTSAGRFITNTTGGNQPTLEGGKLKNNVVGLRFMYFIN
jgi:opacity protein-like surface antigen